MKPYLQKKRSYIYNLSVLLSFLILAFLGNSHGQTTLKLHFVSTEKKAVLSPEQLIQISEIARSSGVKVVIDQFFHPQVDRMAELSFDPSIPFFSREMRRCRDSFFNSSHQRGKSDYYIFLTNQQVDSLHAGFALPGKHIIFISIKPKVNFIARFTTYFLLASSDQKGQNRIALDSLAKQNSEWQRNDSLQYSFNLFHDDTESLGSKNGMVAFAFWEELQNGSIQFGKISMPFKRNSGKVNLDIDNYWLRPIYRSENLFIAPIHVALVGLAFFIMLIFRKKVNERADKSLKIHTRIGLRMLRLLLWILFFVIGYIVFFSTDQLYKALFFNSSTYHNVKDLNTGAFINHLTTSNSVINQPATQPFWEVYIKKRKRWNMKRMDMVLYFKVIENKEQTQQSTEFLYDSPALKIKSYNGKVQTHLIVKKVFNENGKFIREEVYNYAGINITSKFSEVDPSRKILVFVNGYRPVANGGSPQDALLKIGDKGVEFPNSSNVLYPNDRFSYWEPWGAFDAKFVARVNPNEVFYADGHHSVNTSNHGSLLYFAKAASEFPKPCKGKHHCTYAKTSTGSMVPTLSMLPFKPNKAGFKLRRKHGRIAGRNLVQLLNEVPGNSANDTIIIVAHSMGYAYALGMIDALRNHCHFGEFYIFAPENAESGKVVESEWQAVYQYGSMPRGPNKQAPCLQDGVAPQTKVKGLSAKNRLTFPDSYYRKLGFTGSHFIGYYDWVFDIQQGKKGAIKGH